MRRRETRLRIASFAGGASTLFLLLLLCLSKPKATAANENAVLDRSSSSSSRSTDTKKNIVLQHQLSCETQADGSILCQFALPPPSSRKEKENANDNNSSKQKPTTKMKFCFDYGLCVEAQVVVQQHKQQQQIIKTTSSRSKQEEKKRGDVVSDKEYDDHKRKDNTLHHREEPRGQDDIARPRKAAKEEEGNQMNDATSTFHRHEDLSLVRISANGTITVGEYEYNEPYEKYGSNVEDVLRRYSNYMKQQRQQPQDDNHDRNGNDDANVDDLILEAKWLQSLGLAHKRRASDQEYNKELADDDFDLKSFMSDDDDKEGDDDEYDLSFLNDDDDLGVDINDFGDEEETEIKKALNALSVASKIYLRIRHGNERHHDNDDEDQLDNTVAMYDAMYGLAGVYVEMSEVYELSETVDNDSVNRIAYMTKAEELYRAVADSHMGSEHHTDALVKRATCCVSIGVFIIDEHGENIDVDILVAETGMDDDHVRRILMDPNKAGKVFGAEYKEILETYFRAERYFDNAIHLLDVLIARESDPGNLDDLKRRLGTAWENKATAASMRGDQAGIIKNGERAVSVYQEILNKMDSKKETEAVAMHMGDTLQCIAAAFLKLGLYNEASSRFVRSMNFHDQYESFLVPPNSCYDSVIWYGDDDTEVYLEALEEYEMSVRSSLDYDIPDEEGLADAIYEREIHYYERDDAYEAALRMALGSMYLVNSEPLEAKSQLELAVQLFAGSDDDDIDDEVFGDTKYNLAVAYCVCGEYANSARMYREAMSIYHVALGPKNRRDKMRDKMKVAHLLESTLKKKSLSGDPDSDLLKPALKIPLFSSLDTAADKKARQEQKEINSASISVDGIGKAKGKQKNTLDLADYWREALSIKGETLVGLDEAMNTLRSNDDDKKNS